MRHRGVTGRLHQMRKAPYPCIRKQDQSAFALMSCPMPQSCRRRRSGKPHGAAGGRSLASAPENRMRRALMNRSLKRLSERAEHSGRQGTVKRAGGPFEQGESAERIEK